MSRQAPDLALRKLVAELADASAEDVEAILQELSAPRRDQVRALFDEMRGQTLAPPIKAPQPDPAPSGAAVRLGAARMRGLSPWLAARLDRAGGRESASKPPAGGDFTMTKPALAALQASADTLLAARPGLAGEPGGSWLSGLGGLLPWKLAR